MKKSTICLNMIVKDEAHVIVRCLDSVRSIIDRWVIVDTGSTDGTQRIIRQHMADIPGGLFERPWRGFGANRTEAIQLAGASSDFLLFIDADDMIDVPDGFEMPALTADAYDIDIEYGQLRYRRTTLVRSTLPWRFEGVLHEYLDCDAKFTKETLSGLKMKILGGGGRTLASKQEKFHRDAATLESAMLTEPDNTRYAFYLAQSYRDAGNLEAALIAYDKRARMGGFDQEIYISLLSAARIAARLDHPQGEILERFFKAYEFRPTRAESLGELMAYLRMHGSPWHLIHLIGRRAVEIPLSTDSLFVEPAWYEWKCLDELSIAAYWIGHFEQAKSICERLLQMNVIPEDQRRRVTSNLNFSRMKLGLAAIST